MMNPTSLSQATPAGAKQALFSQQKPAHSLFTKLLASIQQATNKQPEKGANAEQQLFLSSHTQASQAILKQQVSRLQQKDTSTTTPTVTTQTQTHTTADSMSTATTKATTLQPIAETIVTQAEADQGLSLQTVLPQPMRRSEGEVTSLHVEDVDVLKQQHIGLNKDEQLALVGLGVSPNMAQQAIQHQTNGLTAAQQVGQLNLTQVKPSLGQATKQTNAEPITPPLLQAPLDTKTQQHVASQSPSITQALPHLSSTTMRNLETALLNLKQPAQTNEMPNKEREKESLLQQKISIMTNKTPNTQPVAGKAQQLPQNTPVAHNSIPQLISSPTQPNQPKTVLHKPIISAQAVSKSAANAKHIGQPMQGSTAPVDGESTVQLDKKHPTLDGVSAQTKAASQDSVLQESVRSQQSPITSLQQRLAAQGKQQSNPIIAQNLMSSAATRNVENAPQTASQQDFTSGQQDMDALFMESNKTDGKPAKGLDFQAQLAYKSQRSFSPADTMLEIVRHAKNGSTSLELQLEPAHLGKIHVSLQLDAAKQIQVMFTVEQSASRQALEQQMPQLRLALAQQGLDLGGFSMQMNQQQHGEQQGSSSSGQQANGNHTQQEQIQHEEVIRTGVNLATDGHLSILA